MKPILTIIAVVSGLTLILDALGYFYLPWSYWGIDFFVFVVSFIGAMPYDDTVG